MMCLGCGDETDISLDGGVKMSSQKHCTVGCPCGNSCISCKKRCTK